MLGYFVATKAERFHTLTASAQIDSQRRAAVPLGPSVARGADIRTSAPDRFRGPVVDSSWIGAAVTTLLELAS